MKNIFFVSVVLLSTVSVLNASALERRVEAVSVSSGVYEDGKFTPKSDGFDAVYHIDGARDKITLKRIISNNREGKYEQGAEYEITNTLESKGLSDLFVERNKKGQEILTAVRDSGLGASETIMIGRDFYQYFKAENGRFYLEYGEVHDK